MPLDRARYPRDWEAISLRIRQRSGGRCEGPPLRQPGEPRCEAWQGDPHPLTGSRVVLTVAHVHNPEPHDCRDENLMALCQFHHLNHDRAHHVAKAKRNRRAQKASGDLFSGVSR